MGRHKAVDVPAVGEDSVIDRRVRNFTVLQGWEDKTNRPWRVNESGTKLVPDFGLELPLVSHVFEQGLVPISGGHLEDTHSHGGVELVLHDWRHDGDDLNVPSL
jgi:hypothetical protein